jgi:hypothetical protein
MADHVTALVHFPSRQFALLSALGALRLRAPTIHARYGATSP